jgi:hypothetical protein
MVRLCDVLKHFFVAISLISLSLSQINKSFSVHAHKHSHFLNEKI